MSSSDSLRSSIESLLSDFAAQLEALVRQTAVERVTAALGGEPPRAARGRPRKAGRRASRGGKRSSVDMESMQENLLTFVKANPGQRADQIAGAIGSDVKTIRLPMQKLLASRKVKTQGQRRGMTYYAGAGGPGRPAGRSGKGKARKGRARARK